VNSNKTEQINESYKIRCPLCETSILILLVCRNTYSLYRCKHCGLIFKHIGSLKQGGVQELQDCVYTESYMANRSYQRRLIKGMNKHRLGVLNKWMEGGDLLEIGCGTGEFLEEARKKGFNACGVDASQRLATYALKKQIEVKYGRIEDLRLQLHHFHVICMFHLIEHIEKPMRFLKSICDLLQKNGILFIITPNAESFSNKIFGWQHPNYTQDDHLCFFSKRTLKKLLAGQGFEVVDIFSKEYAHHFFSSFLGFLRTHLKTNGTIFGLHENRVINKKMEGKLFTKLKSGIKRIAWQTPFYLGVLLSPFSVLYRILVEKAVRGHELIVIARKT